MRAHAQVMLGSVTVLGWAAAASHTTRVLLHYAGSASAHYQHMLNHIIV
jgi:hypothetical protein